MSVSGGLMSREGVRDLEFRWGGVSVTVESRPLPRSPETRDPGRTHPTPSVSPSEGPRGALLFVV